MWMMTSTTYPLFLTPKKLPSLNSRGRDSNNWSHLLHSAIITPENLQLAVLLHFPPSINK
ncbi:hypothetical protein BHE74_00037656 [Ensete ventricosum]|nr:hypothetical protein B296_00001919 [Ensete ventricosum]RWW01812.1 hypothetical protein GW17_00035130 [Ensete ventricosum]RWW55679.1 hypothetical protein BHE74_00037656 [Ensete ventricosum]RZS13757.1 hypothetical protein BHM03_00045398 [Ensete ventricosum]